MFIVRLEKQVSMNKYNLFELIVIRFPYDNGHLTKICHALDSNCLSVGSSDQALFGSTSLIPVAAPIFVKASFFEISIDARSTCKDPTVSYLSSIGQSLILFI